VLESGCFSQVTLDFSHNEALQNTQLGGFEAILFSSYVGTHKDGAPQASLDLDANRRVLLDRAENGDAESREEMPFSLQGSGNEEAAHQCRFFFAFHPSLQEDLQCKHRRLSSRLPAVGESMRAASWKGWCWTRAPTASTSCGCWCIPTG
jgi:hypothetical protein